MFHASGSTWTCTGRFGRRFCPAYVPPSACRGAVVLLASVVLPGGVGYGGALRRLGRSHRPLRSRLARAPTRAPCQRAIALGPLLERLGVSPLDSFGPEERERLSQRARFHCFRRCRSRHRQVCSDHWHLALGRTRCRASPSGAMSMTASGWSTKGAPGNKRVRKRERDKRVLVVPLPCHYGRSLTGTQQYSADLYGHADQAICATLQVAHLLARHLQAGGRGFESHRLHQRRCRVCAGERPFSDLPHAPDGDRTRPRETVVRRSGDGLKRHPEVARRSRTPHALVGGSGLLRGVALRGGAPVSLPRVSQPLENFRGRAFELEHADPQ